MQSAPYLGRHAQSFNDFAMLQVRLNDFIDVTEVDIAVPGTFRVNHRNRTRRTPVQTPRLVHPHLAGAVKPRLLDARLAMVESGLGLVLGTASLAIGTFVETEEDVVLVV